MYALYVEGGWNPMTIIDIKTKLVDINEDSDLAVSNPVDLVEAIFDHNDSYVAEHSDNPIWIQGTPSRLWDMKDIKCSKCKKPIDNISISWFTNAIESGDRQYRCGVSCLDTKEMPRRIYKAHFVNTITAEEVESLVHEVMYFLSFINDDLLLETMFSLHTHLEPDASETTLLDSVFDTIITLRESLKQTCEATIVKMVDKYFYKTGTHDVNRGRSTYNGGKNTEHYRDDYDYVDNRYAYGVGHYDHATTECPVCKAKLCDKQYTHNNHENLLEHAARTGHVSVLGTIELVEKKTEVVCS